MRFEKRERPLDTGYFSKDLFWWEGVYYTHLGDIFNDDLLAARVYAHNGEVIVAVTDEGTNCCLNDENFSIIDFVETETGLELKWQVWEVNRGRWQS